MQWWKRTPRDPDDDSAHDDADDGSQDSEGHTQPASPELFETWLAEMDPKITGFTMFGLPRDFAARPYSREALGEIQDVIRSRLTTPDQVSDGSATPFVDGAVRLIGETLIRHIGGHWFYTTDAGVSWRGRPVLVLDTDQSAEENPIDVLGLVASTVERPRHDVLLDVFDLHLAAHGTASPTDSRSADPRALELGSRLESWLATMDAELDSWKNGPAAPADRWDHSLASLDLLGDWLIEHFPAGTQWGDGALTAEQEHQLTGAARYFGQTLLAHYPGQWRYSEDEKNEHNPFAGTARVTRQNPQTQDPISVVPEVTIGVVLHTRQPYRIGKKAQQYAPRV